MISTSRIAHGGGAARSKLETEGSRGEHSSRSRTAPSTSGIGSSTGLEGTTVEPNENPDQNQREDDQN